EGIRSRELNSEPLEEQSVLLTAKTALQPPNHFFFFFFF
ncbi:rCG31081, partial [Rattus norvegicus]